MACTYKSSVLVLYINDNVKSILLVYILGHIHKFTETFSSLYIITTKLTAHANTYTYRSNGTLLGGSNSFLHATHVSGQGWLVTDSRGDTTQQGGYFGSGLGKAENVVNEEQHVLPLLISEVLGDGQASQSNTGTSARWLVHLSIYQRYLQ